MTREEKRMEAALKYANAVTDGVKDDVYFDIVMKTHLDATKWADNHPKYLNTRMMFLIVCKFLDTNCEESLLKGFDWNKMSEEFETYFNNRTEI